MSGIEIAGLVLGSIPIIISAVELCQTGYEKSVVPFRRRRHVDQLCHALLLQQRILTETIRMLTVHSGCGDQEGVTLDDDPLGFLQNVHIHDQLLDFLGDANHKALIGSLQEITIALKGIANQLLGLVPTQKVRLWLRLQ